MWIAHGICFPLLNIEDLLFTWWHSLSNHQRAYLKFGILRHVMIRGKLSQIGYRHVVIRGILMMKITIQWCPLVISSTVVNLSDPNVLVLRLLFHQHHSRLLLFPRVRWSITKLLFGFIKTCWCLSRPSVMPNCCVDTALVEVALNVADSVHAVMPFMLSTPALFFDLEMKTDHALIFGVVAEKMTAWSFQPHTIFALPLWHFGSAHPTPDPMETFNLNLSENQTSIHHNVQRMEGFKWVRLYIILDSAMPSQPRFNPRWLCVVAGLVELAYLAKIAILLFWLETLSPLTLDSYMIAELVNHLVHPIT